MGYGTNVILLDGTYSGPVYIATHGGSLKADNKWGAVISGAPLDNGIYIGAGKSNVVLDGLKVVNAGLVGIKLGDGGHNTARNCWVTGSGHDADHANGGTGIYVSPYGIGNVVEYCLSESNGIPSTAGHGLYVGGTNQTVRGNVIRANYSYGAQIYVGYTGMKNAECRMYNNLIYGNGNTGRDCLAVYAGPTGEGSATTNYVYGNTLSCTSGAFYTVVASSGVLWLTNNVILGGGGSDDGKTTPVIAIDSASVKMDYNLFTNWIPSGTGITAGGHNVLASGHGLLSPNTGLYWPTISSAVGGAAASLVYGPVDFWGSSQSGVSDIGAFQYTAANAADTRTLDPSSSNPDYWLKLGGSADTNAPVISGVEYVVSYPYADVTWVTDKAAKSGLEWGTTTSYGSSTTNASLVTSHALTSGSLNQGTTYHYRVHSTDSAGNHAQSSDGTFTTTAAPVGKVTLRGTVTVRGLKP
jgi:hypothetical protein